MAGKCICGSDGVVRVFWMHGCDDLSGNDDPLTGNPLSATGKRWCGNGYPDWWSEREVIPFLSHHSQCRRAFRGVLWMQRGAVIINGKPFYPVMWMQRQGSFQQEHGVHGTDAGADPID